MSEANLAVVRSIHDAWLAGERADDWMSADIEYVNPEYALESGIARGPDAFQRIFEVWEGFRFEPERLIEADGERVVVTGRAHVGGLSGIALQDELAYVWTIRDGRAVRFEWFRQVEEAFAAAGLAPGT